MTDTRTLTIAPASAPPANLEAEYWRADAAQWRGRYMAAHDVLLCVEEFIERTDRPDRAMADWDSYRQMRAAFLAYRAAVEAGAPLGWQVAEEGAEVEG